MKILALVAHLDVDKMARKLLDEMLRFFGMDANFFFLLTKKKGLSLVGMMVHHFRP